jgi:hypothetical protein
MPLSRLGRHQVEAMAIVFGTKIVSGDFMR